MEGNMMSRYVKIALALALSFLVSFLPIQAVSANTITISTIPYGSIIAYENSPIRYFSVSTAGTYNIETSRPGQNGIVQDTVIYLYNNANQLVASSDDIDGSSCQYSRISTYLAIGTYKLVITRYPGQTTGIACYLSIYKSGSLCLTSWNYPAWGYGGYSGTPAPYQTQSNSLPYIVQYSNLAFDYTYLSGASSGYNCLAFAMGITNQAIWPWGLETPLPSEVNTFFTYDDVLDDRGIPTAKYYVGHTYSAYSSPSSGRIALYVAVDGRVKHFSIIETTGCKAKLGGAERMHHSSNDAYYSYSSYGSLFTTSYYG